MEYLALPGHSRQSAFMRFIVRYAMLYEAIRNEIKQTASRIKRNDYTIHAQSFTVAGKNLTVSTPFLY